MSVQTDLEKAIEQCNDENIHIPGAIQPYGALIATDSKLEEIQFASTTTEKLLGIASSELLGSSIDTILESKQAHDARNALSHKTIEAQREIIGESVFDDKRFQMSIHRKASKSIIEFLPINEVSNVGTGALEKTRSLLAESMYADTFQTMLNVSAENLRFITGFDRVKAYRFLPDGAGEVIAESKSSSADSFLGLRFPATDIPEIARKLYTTTPIRVIANLYADDAPIIALPAHTEPLDLSLAVLRGTANVHVQYLQNMGVKSSMTIPIIVNGVLWGLFSLHHMKATVPDPTVLLAAELAGKMLSLNIQHAVQTKRNYYLGSCAAIANDIFTSDGNELTSDTYWETYGGRIIEAISSDGVAFINKGTVERGGEAPDAKTCLAVRDYALAAEPKNVISINDLQMRMPDVELGHTAGALVITLNAESKVNLILFRNLAINNIAWAGSQEKQLVKTAQGVTLNPRNSFERYLDSVKGMCTEWSYDDIDFATVLQDALSWEFSNQLERKDSQYRLRLLVNELNHRVRNILTLVQSVSSNSKSSATSLESYAAALEQRIVALAGAHNLLTKDSMRGVELRKLAFLELRPYMSEQSQTTTLSGPEVILNPDVAPVIALVLHELTSNAAKYGSLSQPDGRVALTWELLSDGLHFKWLEKDGPTVSLPTKKGFGSSIIENAIPYEFGGVASVEFDPAGLIADFTLPLSEIELSTPISSLAVGSSMLGVKSAVSKVGLKRGLVVEDNYVIAQQTKNWFTEIGFQSTVAVASVGEALAHLDSGSFDFCLLDINLRGTLSAPVAARLTELGTPFAFASGYGSEQSELCNKYNVPFLTKPININELRTVLKNLGVAEL